MNENNASSAAPAQIHATSAQSLPAWAPLLIWGLSVLLGSSSSILTRYTRGVPPACIGFWRVFGAALVMAPWTLMVWHREGRPRVFTRGAVFVGILFGLHFATWSWALVLPKYTIANAMLFIGLQPLMAPWIARPLLGERLGRLEIAGCLLACAGMVWIIGPQLLRSDLHSQAFGSAVTLVSAFLCAAYFVFTRKYRANANVLLFSSAVFLVAAAVQAALALAFNGKIVVGSTAQQNIALAALVLLPTIGGHVLAMFLLRHVKSQMVTLSIPTQFIIGTVLAYFLFNERPSVGFWIGAVIVLSGVLCGLVGSQKSR